MVIEEEGNVPPVCGPCGLTFTWWGCFSLCLWHKPAQLAHSFSFCSCVCFHLYGPFNCISFHKFSWQLCFLIVLFWSYFCFIGPFNYISRYESLPQPWYNPLWLTGLSDSSLCPGKKVKNQQVDIVSHLEFTLCMRHQVSIAMHNRIPVELSNEFSLL